jgi:hypothetical protein
MIHKEMNEGTKVWGVSSNEDWSILMRRVKDVGRVDGGRRGTSP